MTYPTGAPTALAIQGLEWIIILIILAILFIFGPQKIPELMRGLGRGMGEFQRGKQEIERELKKEMAEASVDEERRDFERKVLAAGKELGVDVEGRGQKEIKLDIAKKLDGAKKEQVVAAARTLGVATEGVELSRLKASVIKKLGV